MLRRSLCLLTAAALSLAAAAVPAQTPPYPHKPLRLIVPYSPGGAVDYIGRLIAQELGDSMGQTVVVDNRPGAGAVIGIEATAKSAGDGYTLLIVDPAIVINQTLQARAPYQMKDLLPVATLTASPLVLTVTAGLPVKDVDGLLKYATKNGGDLAYASAGVGTTPHMAGELLALRTRLPLRHIPYKGSGPAMADLVAGHVPFAFSSAAAAAPFVKEGKLRLLATSGPSRSPGLPDTPTVAETVPGFDVLFWTAVFVPASTPAPVVERLNQEVHKALATPRLLAALAKASEVARYGTVEESARFVADEHSRWAKVIKQANISMQ